MGSFLASLLIALSLIAPRAFAQGGWGELMQAYGLPPAMELAEVDELLAAHAPLLPESTATLARLHSEYLVRFAAFQEKDLGPFRGLYTSRMTGNSDFAGLESLAANRDAIIKHAFSIDASLFDALRPIIQPDRVAGIDRIRRRRELAAFLNTRSMGIASALVADLTTIVLHIPEAQKFRSKWDSTLESYEIVRVRQMREVVSMFIQYGIQMTRLWNEQKVKDVNLESDPEQARIAVEAVRESINVAGAPLQEKCAIVLAYQHKTLKTIEETLPRSVADKVFDAFVVAAYGDIVDGEGMGVPSIARRALRLKSLTDAERDAIRLIATEWRAADQKLMKEVMEVSDETSSRMMMTMDHSVWERVSAAKQDLHARRVARSIEASAAIAAFLGDERQGRVDHPSEDDLLPETGGIDAIDILVGVEGGVPNFDTLGPVCRYAVIPRIPGDQFQSFIVRRAAGSEDVVAALFMDLSDAWEVSVRPHCDAVFAEFFDVALTREGLARAQARAAEARREGSALIDSLIAKVQLVSTTFDADSAVAARTWVACFNAHRAAESAMWILETLPGNPLQVIEECSGSLSPSKTDAAVSAVSDSMVGASAALIIAIENQVAVQTAVGSIHYEHWNSMSAEEMKRFREAQNLSSVANAKKTQALVNYHAASDALLEPIGALLCDKDKATLLWLDRSERYRMVVGNVPDLVKVIQSASELRDLDPATLKALNVLMDSTTATQRSFNNAAIEAMEKYPSPDWDLVRSEAPNQTLIAEMQGEYIVRQEQLSKIWFDYRQFGQRTLLRLNELVGTERLAKLECHERANVGFRGTDIPW